MENTTHYENAPITEALIDLQVQLPEGVTLADLEALHGLVKADYPGKKNRNLVEARMEFGPSVSAASRSTQIGYLFTNDEENQIFQARLDGFTMSRLTPYQSWARVRDEARRLWGLYTEAVRPQGLRRVAVRYINRLDLPLPLGDFRDYLRTVPEVSSELPQGLSGYFFQVRIPHEDIGATLLLNQAMIAPASPDVVSVVLDIDLFRLDGLPSDEAGLWNLLEVLRVRKNAIFEACITDRLQGVDTLMATVFVQSPTAETVASPWFGVLPEFGVEPLGEPGRELRRFLDEVLVHCRERTQCLVSDSTGEVAQPYQQVPFRPDGTVQVRYREAEKLRALPFDLDD